MESVHDVVALAAKANDTCVVFHDGGAMCFGENSENPRRRLDGIQDAVDVTIGRGHACVLRSTGRVACWGDNNYGQLGLGNNTPMSIPTAVLGLADVVAVKAGDFHTCARILNGSVYCWGLNSSGQLGTGNTTNENFPHLVPGWSLPRYLWGVGILALAATLCQAKSVAGGIILMGNLVIILLIVHY
jgi:alpha-tubulin suppressor-like RCC1 family protein